MDIHPKLLVFCCWFGDIQRRYHTLRRLFNGLHRRGLYWIWDFQFGYGFTSFSVRLAGRGGGDDHGRWAAVAADKLIPFLCRVMCVILQQSHTLKRGFPGILLNPGSEVLRPKSRLKGKVPWPPRNGAPAQQTACFFSSLKICYEYAENMIRGMLTYARKIWMTPYHKPFAIAWGVTLVGAYMIPVSWEDKKKSAVYRRYFIEENDH
eukprot:1323784-Amorphochlora_amoeboformis.AAC.1